jgi:NAD-dependent deacetylase
MFDHQKIAEWLQQANSAVVFTGAGISTESGIPDFRSPGGVWSTSQPVYFDDFVASSEARYEYWRQKSLSHREFVDSVPNAGHLVLARWQKAGLVGPVITQNIDGLHQDAGNWDVIELHGTARYVACLECHARLDADPWVKQFLETDCVPNCPDCGGLMKHATISFGQALNPDVLERATTLAAKADLFFAIGSSLVVHPAAGLPPLAKRNGARLIIINRTPTDQDGLADVVLNESIGDALTAIDQALAGDANSDNLRIGRE